MRDVKIPLVKPIFYREIEKAAVNTLLNERFVLRESVCKLEEEFAEYFRITHVDF